MTRMPAFSRKLGVVMLAIDTNVVLRCLVDEDPDQCGRARAIVAGGDVFVSRTVLLETEWVLRGVIGLARAPTIEILRDFIALPTVIMEDDAGVMRALDWAMRGMDLADAMHLSSADHCEAFATFDKKMLKVAKKLKVSSVRAP